MYLAIKLIKTYQYFSKGIYGTPLVLFVPSCRFYPTCSDYAIEAISRHGVLRGVLKAVIRVLRCNPILGK